MKKQKTTLQLLAQASNIGLSFASIILCCAYVGYEADSYFQTEPICLVISLIIGFICAFIGTYQMVKRNSLW